MNVAGYVRVSTREQKADGSHSRQREQLEEWADRNGHDLDLYEDIAISGQSDDRPAYDEMMASLEAYDAVAVRELSRFGRSLKQVLTDIERLNDNGVEFVSVNEEFSTDSAMGTAMMQMIGVFNEFWSNLAQERAEQMVQRRKEKGEPVGRPKKVDDDTLAEIRELHEAGLSYADISRLIEKKTGTSLHRSTVRRYCQDG